MVELEYDDPNHFEPFQAKYVAQYLKFLGLKTQNPDLIGQAMLLEKELVDIEEQEEEDYISYLEEQAEEHDEQMRIRQKVINIFYEQGRYSSMNVMEKYRSLISLHEQNFVGENQSSLVRLIKYTDDKKVLDKLYVAVRDRFTYDSTLNIEDIEQVDAVFREELEIIHSRADKHITKELAKVGVEVDLLLAHE